MSTPSANKKTQQIARLVEKIDIAMLTTVGKGGMLFSRPLSTQVAAFDGQRVSFFTEADSPKVAEITAHPQVNLAYASQDRNTYVSMAGSATIARDPARVRALWSDALKAFFPRGANDPNLVILDVDVASIEYWDGPGTVLGKIVSFVIARVTRREEVMAENRIIDLERPRSRSRLPPSHADGKATRAGSRGHKTAGAASRTPKKTTVAQAGRKIASGTASKRKTTSTARTARAVARSATARKRRS